MLAHLPLDEAVLFDFSMRGNAGKFYLHLLIILSFIGAGISPACKFISGQMTLMEICSGVGTKMVAVPADQVPESEPSKSSMQDRCSFCLASAHIKVMAAQDVVLHNPAPAYAPIEQPEADFLVVSVDSSSFDPRGPPASV